MSRKYDALVTFDEENRWAAQSVWYDIVTAGCDDAGEAHRRLVELIEDQAAVDAGHGREPMAGCERDPKTLEWPEGCRR